MIHAPDAPAANKLIHDRQLTLPAVEVRMKRSAPEDIEDTEDLLATTTYAR